MVNGFLEEYFSSPPPAWSLWTGFCPREISLRPPSASLARRGGPRLRCSPATMRRRTASEALPTADCSEPAHAAANDVSAFHRHQSRGESLFLGTSFVCIGRTQ